MSKEKQIDEIAKLICTYPQCIHYNIIGGCGNTECQNVDNATAVYNAGYCKQSEGEWIAKTDYAGYGYYCSNCNAVFTGENAEWIAKEHYYCPKCGAKMKGGAE